MGRPHLCRTAAEARAVRAGLPVQIELSLPQIPAKPISLLVPVSAETYATIESEAARRNLRRADLLALISAEVTAAVKRLKLASDRASWPKSKALAD